MWRGSGRGEGKVRGWFSCLDWVGWEIGRLMIMIMFIQSAIDKRHLSKNFDDFLRPDKEAIALRAFPKNPGPKDLVKKNSSLS